MKRIRSACILQTLVFSQKPEMGYGRDYSEKLNREEYENYKAKLSKTQTRHQIISEAVENDGSIVVRIRKQYNDSADVSEYFE